MPRYHTVPDWFDRDYESRMDRLLPEIAAAFPPPPLPLELTGEAEYEFARITAHPGGWGLTSDDPDTFAGGYGHGMVSPSTPELMAGYLPFVLPRMIEVRVKGKSPAEVGYEREAIELLFGLRRIRWPMEPKESEFRYAERFALLSLRQMRVVAEVLRLVAFRRGDTPGNVLRDVPPFWLALPRLFEDGYDWLDQYDAD